MKQCDVFVLAGSVLDFRLGYGKSIPEHAKIIQLDIDNVLIGHNRSPEASLVGNLGASLRPAACRR